MTRRISRSAALMALLLTWGLAAASSASAHTTRQYWTLSVPAQDHVPQSQRLYATLGGVGNGNRLGDPVILATRAGVNPRQEWWFAERSYPYVDNTIRGGSPHLAAIGDFFEDCFHLDLPPIYCKFEGQSGVYKVRVKLVNRYSGKCLTVNDGPIPFSGPKHGDPIVQQTCVRDSGDQIWTYVLNNEDERRQNTHVEELQPFSNSHTCLGPQQRSAGHQLRVFGGPGICPHWVLHPSLRDHRYPQTFVNPF